MIKNKVPCKEFATPVSLDYGIYCSRCFLTRDEHEHWMDLPRAFKQLAKKYANKRKKSYLGGFTT